MRNALHCRWFAAAVASSFAVMVSAQPPQVTSELHVQRVQLADGHPVDQPAKLSEPGDVLEYQLSYANRAPTAVAGLVASLPIPTGTTLVDIMHVSAGAEGSTDSVHFSPVPLTRLVRQPDGHEQRVPVPLEEYRSLRWNLGSLPAQAVKQVEARVRVNALPDARAASVATPPAG